MKRSEHIVVARVHNLLLGFDVRDVREVLNDELILPVPLTPAVVRGLVNLRGEVVTVIDARTLFRCPERAGDHRPTYLVVQHRRDMLSLEVIPIRGSPGWYGRRRAATRRRRGPARQGPCGGHGRRAVV